MEDGFARFPCLEDPLSDSEQQQQQQQQQQQSILIIIWWQLYVGKNQSHAHNFQKHHAMQKWKPAVHMEPFSASPKLSLKHAPLSTCFDFPSSQC